MSFLGGGFDLTAGLQGLQQIGDRFTQLRDELEQSIEETIRAERFGLPEAEGAAEAAAEGEADGAECSEVAGEGWEAPDVDSPLAQQPADAEGASGLVGGDGDRPAEPAPALALHMELPLAEDAGSRGDRQQPVDGSPQHPHGGSTRMAEQRHQHPPGDAADGGGPPLAQGAPAADGAAQLRADGLAGAEPEQKHVWADDAARVVAEQPEAGSPAAKAGAGAVATTAVMNGAADSEQPSGSGEVAGPPSNHGNPAVLAQQAPSIVAVAASQSAASAAAAQQEATTVQQSPKAQLAGLAPPSANPTAGVGGEEEGLEAPALRQLVAQLREALAARERQMERKAEEAAQLAEVAEKLQQRNAELAQGSKDGEAVADLQRCVVVCVCGRLEVVVLGACSRTAAGGWCGLSGAGSCMPLGSGPAPAAALQGV